MERVQQFCLDHKEEILENRKKYEDIHLEYKKEQKRQYYLNNKEKFLKYKKTYYEEHKDFISYDRMMKMNCECGSILRHRARSRHINTRKHQNYLHNL